VWVTKIASEKLMLRERLFLEWHQDTLGSGSTFAPAFIGHGLINRSDLGFLTMESLRPIKSVNSDQLFKLYSNCAHGQKLFKEGLLQASPDLESGTRIKDILMSLVCDFESESARTYIKQFFTERINTLPEHSDVLATIQTEIEKCYEILKPVDESLLGFVHGDFKVSNMMMDSSHQLKLIDFQYYCRGIRVWDLAFYFSKSKKSFSDTLEPFLNKLSTRSERQYLVFFYIFAVLLHPKQKVFKQKKLTHALTVLKKLVAE
jgi:hypothetical protein